mgnify:CR=1 FL=1
MAEANWYVVHTYSGYENKVKANIEKTIENRHLEDQILEVRVPMEDVVEVRNGVKKQVQRKLFPGYVLLNMVMNDDTWYVVRNTRGVTGFVGPGSKPVPLTEEEMQRMLNLDVKIIGINNRNLKTFEVDLDTTKKLADMVTPEMRKAGKLLVSESGVADTDDIKVLAKSGADALLIGTVLMEAPEPEELISEFKEVYNAERK